MLDLIEGEMGIKGEMFTNFDDMIPIRSLAKRNLGQETTLRLGLSISQDPTVGFASNFEGL